MKIVMIEQEINGRMVPVKLHLPDDAVVDVKLNSKPDYNTKSKLALIDLAKDKGLEVTSRMTKKALIALLEGES